MHQSHLRKLLWLREYYGIAYMFTEVRLFKREIDQVYNNCHSGFDTAILKNSVLIHIHIVARLPRIQRMFKGIKAAIWCIGVD